MKQFDKLCDIFWEPFLLHHKQRNGSQIPKREVHKKCCLRQNMTIVSSYLNNRNSHMSHLQTVKYWLHSIILECCKSLYILKWKYFLCLFYIFKTKVVVSWLFSLKYPFLSLTSIWFWRQISNIFTRKGKEEDM